MSDSSKIVDVAKKPDAKPGTWKLEGYDTFEGGPDSFYPLDVECDTEAEIIKAARARLEHLEKTQPSKSSGGQGSLGIQDHVYIVNPSGHRRRFRG